MVVWDMKTTIEIPDSLFEEAKSWAAQRGVTLRQIVEEGLRQIIQAKETPKAFRLRDSSFGKPGKRAGSRPWGEIRDTIYEGRGS